MVENDSFCVIIVEIDSFLQSYASPLNDRLEMDRMQSTSTKQNEEYESVRQSKNRPVNPRKTTSKGGICFQTYQTNGRVIFRDIEG